MRPEKSREKTVAFLFASSSKREPHRRCVPVNIPNIFRIVIFRRKFLKSCFRISLLYVVFQTIIVVTNVDGNVAK